MPEIILHLDALYVGYYFPFLPATHVAYSLFDMDGTLVDSTAGVVGAWQLFRQSYPSIDVHYILSCEHRVNFYLFLFVYPGAQLLMEFERLKISERIVASRIPRSWKYVISLDLLQFLMAVL